MQSYAEGLCSKSNSWTQVKHGSARLGRRGTSTSGAIDAETPGDPGVADHPRGAWIDQASHLATGCPHRHLDHDGPLRVGRDMAGCSPEPGSWPFRVTAGRAWQRRGNRAIPARRRALRRQRPITANAGTMWSRHSPASRIARHAITLVGVPPGKIQHFPADATPYRIWERDRSEKAPTTATAPAIASASHMAAVPEAWNPEP